MCISCLHCAYSKGHIECSINVRAGRELEFLEMQTIDEKRRVVIIGGGPGGMEAAKVLRIKGYDVKLFEKKDQLCGHLNLVTDPVYKKKMKRYVHYLCHEMERLNVDIRLNTEALVEQAKSLNPYAVLLATGETPLEPDIKGYALPNVCNYRDIKLKNNPFHGKRIAVLGSGMVFHSTVRRLSEQGNDVTLVEVPTKSGSKISPATRAKLLEKLKHENINIITVQTVREILPNGVMVEIKETGELVEIEVDQVVIAMGVQAYNPLEEPLRREMGNVFVIGDAAGHISLADAARGGFENAFVLESLVNNHVLATV
ncbi:FAD-dependent oxidoreductase [Neobacillus cucumis]|uniref:FAD-dependent oxidoreductase n=2 Tax=Neobacillus cucumis TaxID=1740721 RepID=UPI0035F2BC80